MESLEAWVSTLRLKKTGGEFSGPCPICGGTDRFHVKQGYKHVLAHCRQCQSHIKELANATFKKSNPLPPTSNRPAPYKPAPNPVAIRARLREFSNSIHDNLGLSINAKGWINRKRLDPERLEIKGWRSLPANLRPMPPEGISWANYNNPLILMPYTDTKGLHSYRYRNLDGGKPLSFKGSNVSIYNIGEVTDLRKHFKLTTLHVCEGESDTESLLEAGAKAVIGLPGCMTCHDEVVKFTLRRFKKIILWFDADNAGMNASLRLGAKLKAKRKLTLTIPWERLGNFEDVNNLWQKDNKLLTKMVNELT